MCTPFILSKRMNKARACWQSQINNLTVQIRFCGADHGSEIGEIPDSAGNFVLYKEIQP